MKQSARINRTLRLLLTLALFAVFTSLLTSTVLAAPKIKELEYEGSGLVDVEFKTDVVCKNLKITVRDADGNTYGTKIKKKESDNLRFKVLSYKSGREYRFTVSGIRAKSEKTYGKIKGTFVIPKRHKGINIKEIKYDPGDGEVDFEFFERVEFKNPKVTVTSGGKNYVTKIKEKQSREIEVLVKKLVKGKTYNDKITGIRKKGTKKYVTIKGTFTA